MMAKDAQRWDLTVHGRCHRVEIAGAFLRTIRWYAADVLVATKTSLRSNHTIEAEGDIGCVLELHLGVLAHSRRVTLFEADNDLSALAKAEGGAGGIDLDPEPGSPAARHEQRIREHPGRHTAIAIASGAAKVVVPLVMGLLVVRFAISLPWPSWSISWPDINPPTIPWPQIPWPDITLPDWERPKWVGWVLGAAQYSWPVLLAVVVAKIEIERRREQDSLKAKMRNQTSVVTQAHKDEPHIGPEA
jgi:hypothetical protein